MNAELGSINNNNNNNNNNKLKNQWFVVHTKPKQEFRALEQLKNQGYLCFLPTLQKEKKIRREITLYEEPLFSRYLFIELNSQTAHWGPIRSTRGVHGLVTFGGTPTPLPDEYIPILKNGPRPPRQSLFTPGEIITITEGAFSGLDAIYQIPDGQTRAYVLLNFMSGLQRLNLPISTLQKNSNLILV